jgi:hypothetical protein
MPPFTDDAYSRHTDDRARPARNPVELNRENGPLTQISERFKPPMPPPRNEPEIPIPVTVPPMRIWSIESMFTCMLRFRSVREEALFVLKRGYFNHAGEGYLAYLFELIQRLHPAHHDREQIPFQILANVALEETIPGHETQAALLSQDETEKLVAIALAPPPLRPAHGRVGPDLPIVP